MIVRGGQEELIQERETSDEKLVREALAQDREAFNALIRRHNLDVNRKVERILRGRPEVDDAVQRTWLLAYRRLEGLRDPAQFRAWVMQIAKNEALGVLRRSKRLREVALLPEMFEKEIQGDMEDRVTTRRILKLTSSWIQEMGELDQRLFFYSVVEGMTMDEIAGRVGMSEGGVKTRLFRAREVLRAARSRHEARC